MLGLYWIVALTPKVIVQSLPTFRLTLSFFWVLSYKVFVFFIVVLMARASPSQEDRSENPIDESQSSPDVEASSLLESNVERLLEQFYFLEQFQLFALGVDGRMNNPPSGQVAFYVEDLRMGLRFSISKFVRNILDYYGFCPTQLAPNSVRLIISFALLYQMLPIIPRPSLFRVFFIL